MSARLTLLILLFALTPALWPGVASARSTELQVTGWTKAPGPRVYDRLDVTTYGSAKARTVLVLIPGTYGGRGDFALVGPALTKRIPGLQVWALDRRSQRLEDQRTFAAALSGKTTPQTMFDYYLGWLANPAISDHYQPPDLTKLGFAADWGLRLLMEDTRRVVMRARRGGRRVILGGHSLGASAALAYAAWDFSGRAGHRDLAGLVLLDGGLRGSFVETTSAAAARKRLAAIRKQPFLDLLGLGVPWAAGVFAQVGATLAALEPNAPSPLQSFPLLPAALKPPMPVSNASAFGHAFDATTSPKNLSLIHARLGSLGSDGSWQQGEVTKLGDLISTFARTPGNATEWFYPARLNLDVDAASPMRTTAASRLLGLRLHHTREIRLPLYAIQSSLTGGRVLAGARRAVSDTQIASLPRSQRVLVDASSSDSHLDSLTAAEAESRFLKTATPFLRSLAAR